MVEVKHTHFTNWKDFSVPSTDGQFRDMIDEAVFFVNQVEKSKSGEKMLVHCRAGIGRTGTTVAIINAILKI
jgi:protein tyrosine phosphatase